MNKRYLLKHKTDPDLFWVSDQWIDHIYSEAVLYTKGEKNSMTLPKDGEWVLVK